MKTEIQIVDPKEFGLEEQKGKSIESAFTPKLIERDAFSKQYETIIKQELNQETFKQARELRLKLVKVRTGIADIHKTEKAFYLASGKYVDALKNKLTLPIEQMEEKLIEIEKYEERLEAERKAKIKIDREEKLSQFGTDTTFIQLDQMSEDQFNSLFDREKLVHDAKIEAEKKAEEQRIEAARLEDERIEAQRIENERLKKEAEAREKEIELERQRLAKDQEKKDAEAKAERDRLAKEAADAKELADKLKAEQDAEKKRIEAEEEDRLAAEKAKQLAPDKEKINAMFLAIKNFNFPDCESQEAKQIISEIKQGFELILNVIKTAAKTLK